MKRHEKALLGDIPGFRGLGQEHLERIRSVAVRREYAKGEHVFFEGEEGEGFFVVLRGSIKVYKMSPEGKEIILHICGRGDHFGQVAVYAGRTYPANALALRKSEALFFPRQAFQELMARDPSLGWNMLSVLSLRLRELTRQVESLALKEVPGRLASYLLHLAESQKGPGAVVLDMSKAQLASMLGTTPETLSRIFADMAARELIVVDRREVVLLDPEGLEALAEQGRYH